MSGLDTKHSVPADQVRGLLGCKVYGFAYTLDVKRNGQPAKPRTYHVVTRMGPGHGLGVFNNNVAAVERALLERYFFCLVGGSFHQALRPEWGAFKTSSMVRFRDECVRRAAPLCSKISREEVVDLYTGAKRKLYARANVSLSRKPVNKSDATLRPFTKFEKQPLDKACRIINPRSPRFNLELGCYLKHTEKVFYNAVNEVWGARTGATVVKGFNARETAKILREKWEQFESPVGVGLDATKFDMHVSVDALRYEHEFYNAVYRDPKLEELLSWQIFNRGTARCPDGVVKFTMPGTRSSGDLNTSLGNCLLMCAMMHSLCESAGVRAELCNNGDDCVLIMESCDARRLVELVPGHFQALGFRMEVEPAVDVFERLTFCQSSPVWVDGWLMVRDVRTCLRKDPMCLVPVQSERVWRKWLGAVGEGGGALVSGVPVLQEFYAAFRRSGSVPGDGFKRHVYRGTSHDERASGLACAPRPIMAESRASFWRAFGITPDYQIGLEKYYLEVNIAAEWKSGGHGAAEVSPPPCLGHL